MNAVEAQASPIPSIQSSSYPLRTGNLLQPLIDSGPTFRRLCEAIDRAQRSVWLAVTFIDPDFQMPDNRGTIFDVLNRAASRGLDVRVIFWRPLEQSSRYGKTFAGTPEDHALLRARNIRFKARWDCAIDRFVQHQKFWLMDAGEESETAFIGGINPTFGCFEPGHDGAGQRHDIYVEVTGPCCSDVHHNCVQRWNEASERGKADGRWNNDDGDRLPFPARISASRGESVVQIQRNMHAGLYDERTPTPDGIAYDLLKGERSITGQYLLAIAAARHSIYIENQALPVPEIARPLEQALKRGVEIVMLVPAEPEDPYGQWRRGPAKQGLFDHIDALGQYANFTLAGIAGRTAEGKRSSVYVHSKIMLIDDEWATLGSCNLHSNSLFGHGELNATVWDRSMVRSLRCRLLSEHLGEDTAHLESEAALRLFKRIAQENTARLKLGRYDWQGLAISLDPAAYGSAPIL